MLINPLEQVWDVYVFDRSIHVNLFISMYDQSRDVAKLTLIKQGYWTNIGWVLKVNLVSQISDGFSTLAFKINPLIFLSQTKLFESKATIVYCLLVKNWQTNNDSKLVQSILFMLYTESYIFTVSYSQFRFFSRFEMSFYNN